MASFDVENLYTNIPLDETIQICLEKIFTNVNFTILGLNRTSFRTLLELAVKFCFFVFDNKFYRQIDGLGMGLPLGPTFANIFLCHHEERWLAECPSLFKPVFYNRYIDDCFLLFKSESHVSLFLNYLNTRHSSINFTYELEDNSKISFLDCKVSRVNKDFVTTVHRKDTFTGLGINYYSFCPYRFKINSICTLVHRAYRVCSDYLLLHGEFEFLTNFFKCNGFPIYLVQSKIKTFLASRFGKFNNNEVDTREKIFFSFPYFGKKSETMSKELKDIISKHCLEKNVQIILSNKFTIGSFFRYKDLLPRCLCSSIVYEFSCLQCRSVYVGMTARNLYIRVAEHLGKSFRTGNRIASPSHSKVREHIVNSCPQSVSLDNFKILTSSSNFSDLKILESLYIHYLRPDLNSNDSSCPLNVVV